MKKELEDMNFYEQVVFELEKEKCVCTTEMESRWRKFEDKVDTKKVYRNIVNYRINKYGSSSFENTILYKTKEQCLKDAYKVRKERRKRLNG